jgi:hypothetical protein
MKCLGRSWAGSPDRHPDFNQTFLVSLKDDQESKPIRSFNDLLCGGLILDGPADCRLEVAGR